jgi:hypothetical protein
MTKIGEANSHPQPTEQMYNKNLQDSIIHFENALNGYQVSKNSEETEHLRAMMRDQMELIRSSVNEIKLLGMHKQGEVVHSDYERYMNNSSQSNLIALQQDLSTLKQYNLESKTH